jgi:hypothetical protein
VKTYPAEEGIIVQWNIVFVSAEQAGHDRFNKGRQ